VDGRPVSWLDRPGEEPPIVLLHGWGASAATFAGLLRLSRTRRRILALDLPGFGESPLGHEVWTTTSYAALVSRWLADMAEGGYSLLGHSYGGAISMRLAAGAPGPDRVLFCAPSGIRPEVQGPPSIRVRTFRALRAVASHLPGPLAAPVQERLIKSFGSEDYRAAAPALRPTLVAAVSEDLSAIAAEISIPALIVWGARDPELPREPHAERLRALVGSSALVVLENSGHFPFADEAVRFALIFDSFMEAEV